MYTNSDLNPQDRQSYLDKLSDEHIQFRVLTEFLFFQVPGELLSSLIQESRSRLTTLREVIRGRSHDSSYKMPDSLGLGQTLLERILQSA